LNDPIRVYKPKVESGVLSGEAVSKDRKSEERVSILHSLLSTSSTNVIIETIKLAEDGNGVIVRLYESQRKRGPVQLRAGFGVAAAWETNLLEENESELSVENDTIQLNLKPYQIMTLRLNLK
jgi:alpha-mannosidase